MRLIRTLLVAGVFGLATFAAGCGDDEEPTASGGGSEGGGEVEKISIVQPVPGESTFFYPHLVAKELGFYEDENIEVEYLSASEKLPLPAFVSNGDADVGAAGADEALQAVSKGANFQIVYDEYIKAADVLSVPADSEIQDASQLEGKTIAAAGEDDRVLLRTALSIVGVPVDSVRIVSLGRAGPTTADALKTGKVDAYASGVSDAAVVSAVGGIELRDILPEDIRDRPAASMMITPQSLEERRDAMVRFMRAWAMGAHVGVTNPEAAGEIGCKLVPTECENRAVFDEIVEIATSARDTEGEPYGTLHPDAWERTQEQLMEAGEYENAVDIDSLMNDELIEEINEFDQAEVEKAAQDWLDQNKGS
jgi:NitT/TauT family transport system substrate-binding protein